MSKNTGNYTSVKGINVGDPLYRFITEEALNGLDITVDQFFTLLSNVILRFTPTNRDILKDRQKFELLLNKYHESRKDLSPDPVEQERVEREIGYIVPEGPDFTINTQNVDPEIALIAAPQLVVPALNSRFAINACNARWNSLYDAVYSTDVLGSMPPPGPYSKARGSQVIAYAKDFLDKFFPLAGASYTDVTSLFVESGKVIFTISSGRDVNLADPSQFCGYKDSSAAPSGVLLRHHGLHIELCIDRHHHVGAEDPFGMYDIVVESALSTIIDGEDSSAAVDAEDKVIYYRNWLGLMKGTLEATFKKGKSTLTRKMASNRVYHAPGGGTLTLHGRSLLLTRNVGHLMTTPAVIDSEGEEVFEGLLDAVMTVTLGVHDLKSKGAAALRRNSRMGSIYIVKPKMHGPAEVAFADEVYGFIEKSLGLPFGTVKLGVMDEERRTSVNLKECIRAASNRIFFINTGFLDRTGDEIHTAMRAGPIITKADMKKSEFLSAYEQRNVAFGLKCGFQGRAQVGKGMWAMPDRMQLMMRDKVQHLLQGASCSWVPSPTASTLHAIHYHEVNVQEVQRALAVSPPMALRDLVIVPVARPWNYSHEIVVNQVRDSCQTILGYVVRWVDLGVGCSKVPDTHDVGMMEDRATLRISSQLLANWLLHGVVTEQQVRDTFREMAVVVDKQNISDPEYRAMAPRYNGPAFVAALELVFKGTSICNGYTEPLLHAWRQKVKAGMVTVPEAKM